MKDFNDIMSYFAFEPVPDVDSSDKQKTVTTDHVPFADSDICPFSGPCTKCPYEKECADDLLGCTHDCGECDLDDEEDIAFFPVVDRIVFNDPATIVFWDDGTKTVVKCMKGEKFERYAGFAAACTKKLFGSTSRAKAIMEDRAVEQIKTPKKKKNEQIPGQMSMFDDPIQEAINEALTK